MLVAPSLYSNPINIYTSLLIFKNNFPLIGTLLECGANCSVGKDKDGSEVLHLQAGKADELDLSSLYPDAQVVSDFLV